MKKIYLIVVLLVSTLGFMQASHAVAFKLKNDSSQTLRMRVHDRGDWRPWVMARPGFWGDVAPGVKRTNHAVQVQVLVWAGVYAIWVPYYQGMHGSRSWTRILQIFDNDAERYNVGKVWWDERGRGCRDMPPHPVSGGNSCLKPSGTGGFISAFNQGLHWGGSVYDDLRPYIERVFQFYNSVKK